MGNPVVHFEILGGDGEKLQTFYSNLFNWKINADNPMNYGVVDTGGSGINGGIAASEDGSPHATFYIEVKDVQKALNDSVAAGATIVVPETEIPNMVTFGQFADPAGNIVGLIKSDEDHD